MNIKLFFIFFVLGVVFKLSWDWFFKLPEGRADHEAGDIIYICKPCFEKRYTNQWLGWAVRKGYCDVCHKHTTVDRRPVEPLERRQEP